jgi:zinc transporter ZupT
LKLDPPQPPTSYFDLSSFLSLGAASGMVLVVTNVVRRVFNFHSEIITLAISVVVALIGVAVRSTVIPSSPPPTLIDYLVGVLNGFLIYTTVTGTSAVTRMLRGRLAKNVGQKPRVLR